MEKIISTDDLMLAIGELPEDLVKYPAAHNYSLIKRLSAVAACFIAVISLIFIYPGMPKFDGVGGNNMDSAPNDSNNDQMNNSSSQNGSDSGMTEEEVYVGDISDSPLKFVIEQSYIFYKIGIFDNNNLQIYENAGKNMLMLLPRSIGELYSITALDKYGKTVDLEWRPTSEAALLEIPTEVCALLLESDESEVGIELIIDTEAEMDRRTVTVKALSSHGTGDT